MSNLEKIFKSEVKFVCGSNVFSKLLKYPYKEIAFVGRSNVGKSSIINLLFHKKDLAKVSKTPGRTQAINLFNVKDKFIVADIPGYGFAKVPDKLRNRWDNLLYEYFTKRDNLFCTFILIDSRRGMMEIDMEMIDLLKTHNRKFVIILTKGDLVGTDSIEKIKESIQAYLKLHKIETEIFVSSTKDLNSAKSIQYYIVDHL